MQEIQIERASYSPELAVELGQLNMHLTDVSEGSPVPEDLLRVGTESPFAVQLTARARDTLIGAASLTQLAGLNHRDAWLNDFVVNPDWRSTGVAEALREGWNNWAQERSIDRLLFTSGWGKVAAHKFYQRHGASIINPQGGKTAFFNMPIPRESTEGDK